MLYAEIIDGVPKRWPIIERHLRDILNHISFPQGPIIQKDLEGTNWYCIPALSDEEYAALPKNDPDNFLHLDELVPDPTAVSGFKRSYKLSPIEDPERRAHRLSNQWRIIKRQRKNRLIDSDKLFLQYQRDITLGRPPVVDIFKLETYRQALIDLDDVQDDPFSIVWPPRDYEI